MVSQHALQVVSQHALQFSRGGGIPTCLAGLQAHTQGKVEGSGQGGFQFHTQGQVEGSGLGVSRPTLVGGSLGPHLGGIPACTEAEPPTVDGYCCGQYASYWNVFLLLQKFTIQFVMIFLKLLMSFISNKTDVYFP